MGKVLWWIKCVKNGLQSFSLEIWMMLWLGKPVEVDNDQSETLLENNQHYTTLTIDNGHKILKSNNENHLY